MKPSFRGDHVFPNKFTTFLSPGSDCDAGRLIWRRRRLRLQSLGADRTGWPTGGNLIVRLDHGSPVEVSCCLRTRSQASDFDLYKNGRFANNARPGHLFVFGSSLQDFGQSAPTAATMAEGSGVWPDSLASRRRDRRNRSGCLTIEPPVSSSTSAGRTQWRRSGPPATSGILQIPSRVRPSPATGD